MPLTGQFIRTNVKGIAFENDLKTPMSSKRMLEEILKRGSAQILRLTRGNKDVQDDLNNIVDALTKHLVVQSVQKGLSDIFKSFEELGFAQADLFEAGLSERFIKLHDSAGRLGGVSDKFGMFLEEGIFGVGGQRGASSEIGDIVSIQTKDEIELKAIIGSSDNRHRLKIGGMTLVGDEKSLLNPMVRDIATAYKIVLKMQNLFLMEFGIDSQHYEHITPKRATLFWELIIKNLLTLIRENSKRQMFEIEWTTPKPDDKGQFKSAVLIRLNTQALYNTEKIVQLYLRKHVFFDEKGLSGVSAKMFFGTLRRMAKENGMVLS